MSTVYAFCNQIRQMQRDLQQVLDEKEDLETERDAYRTKHERLNTELNYILGGDDKRIVDIDALNMENKSVSVCLSMFILLLYLLLVKVNLPKQPVSKP